jgi:hypothetical protein
VLSEHYQTSTRSSPMHTTTRKAKNLKCLNISKSSHMTQYMTIYIQFTDLLYIIFGTLESCMYTDSYTESIPPVLHYTVHPQSSLYSVFSTYHVFYFKAYNIKIQQDVHNFNIHCNIFSLLQKYNTCKTNNQGTHNPNLLLNIIIIQNQQFF